MKRLKRYPLIGLTLLVLLWAGYLALSDESADYKKIKIGMHREEVRAILENSLTMIGCELSGLGDVQVFQLWSSQLDRLPPWVSTTTTTLLVFYDQDGLVRDFEPRIEKRNLKDRFTNWLP